jgi:hypothetical protein
MSHEISNADKNDVMNFIENNGASTQNVTLKSKDNDHPALIKLSVNGAEVKCYMKDRPSFDAIVDEFE